MEDSRPEYLMHRLINNKLSGSELEELLGSIGEDEMSPEYSAVLEKYFNQLLAETQLKKNSGSDHDQ
jgi:hypothetical protein